MSNDCNNKRFVYLEILRIIAIFFVVFVHLDGFTSFTLYSTNSVLFWIYLFIAVLCNFTSPIFFAISGAVLLDKSETISVVFLKRILPKALTLICFSILYYCVYTSYPFCDWHQVSTFIFKFYSKQISMHLWFIYAYISFLMMLPLLRKLVVNLEKKYYYYIFLMSICFSVILPIIDNICYGQSNLLNKYFDIHFFVSNIVIYPLLGYFIHKNINMDKIRTILPTFWRINILTIIVTMLLILCNVFVNQTKGIGVLTSFQVFNAIFGLINCGCVFMSIKYLCEKVCLSGRIKTIVFSISKCVFGIYLIHIFFLRLPQTKIFLAFLHSVGVNDMFAAFIECVFVVFVCYLIINVCLKISYLKKLIS